MKIQILNGIKTFIIAAGIASMVGFEIQPDIPASYSQNAVDSLKAYYEDSLTKQKALFDTSLANLSEFLQETYVDSLRIKDSMIAAQVRFIEDMDTCVTFNEDGTMISVINTGTTVHSLELKEDTVWYDIAYKTDVFKPFYQSYFIVPKEEQYGE